MTTLSRRSASKTRSVTMTETQSREWVKKLASVGVSTVLYIRGIFPESHFTYRAIEDVNVKLLKPDGNGPVVALLCSCLKAIEERYLENLTLMFCTDPDDPKSVIESYSFELSYENHTAMSVSRNGEKILSADQDQDMKRNAVLLMRRLIMVSELLDALPDVYVHLRISCVTPPDYLIEGFKETDPGLYSITGESHKIRIGSLKTPFHGQVTHSSSRLYRRIFKSYYVRLEAGVITKCWGDEKKASKDQSEEDTMTISQENENENDTCRPNSAENNESFEEPRNSAEDHHQSSDNDEDPYNSAAEKHQSSDNDEDPYNSVGNRQSSDKENGPFLASSAGALSPTIPMEDASQEIPMNAMSPASSMTFDFGIEIDCNCGYNYDEGAMIECNRCFTWHHGCCYNRLDLRPDLLLCYKCDPEKCSDSALHGLKSPRVRAIFIWRLVVYVIMMEYQSMNIYANDLRKRLHKRVSVISNPLDSSSDVTQVISSP
ncbi:HORMA domain-containing protein 1-like [Oscarella lobularis]|uniref:HORMA domain-containing protein 1-like n=1 Tax=Oscarella lobularis TaxID=121494 RepID=UPI0033141FE6